MSEGIKHSGWSQINLIYNYSEGLDIKTYNYKSTDLAEHWERLHLCDCEPYPSATWVQSQFLRNPEVAKSAFTQDTDELSDQLVSFWCAFHNGDYQAAMELAEPCGLLGAYPFSIAANVYATYLVDDLKEKLALFNHAADKCKKALKYMDHHANTHYMVACNTGRYAEYKGLLQATLLGLTFKTHLEKTLTLEPKHLLATLGAGSFHAGAIDAAGKIMAAAPPYYCTTKKALKYYKASIALAPSLPIVYLEYVKGLDKLYGKVNPGQISDIADKVMTLSTMDNMESLDMNELKRGLKRHG